MASDGKYSKTVNRLTYIDPNLFPNSYYLGGCGLNGTDMSWNPEDLSMSVDLEVIIPRRSDNGQRSYLAELRSKNTNNTNKTPARYISYLGGVPLNEKKGSKSYLTDRYTDISFSEIRDGKVVNQESLGINSIDINFDAHFFPTVIMKFTDVRGSALFMPSEQEFEESVGKESHSSASSFFKALFHFPYPRFLLSVKGFYGGKVTFQLSVSDFRSSFQSETGNYDVTVQFIGYMYGFYTDLPFNLIMAAPYYNQEYWNNKVNDGVFKYVSSSGGDGGKILKYPEFIEVVNKKVSKNNNVFEGAEKTKEYVNAKEKKTKLEKILMCHKNLVMGDDKNNNAFKILGDKYVFVYGYDPVATSTGFPFNADAAKTYYDTLREYFNNFTSIDDISLVTQGNVFFENFKANINAKNDTEAVDKIKNDNSGSYVINYFGNIRWESITKYFTFNENIIETNGIAYNNISKNDAFKTIVVPSDGKLKSLTDTGNRFAINSNIIEGTKITKQIDTPNSVLKCKFIEYASFCKKLSDKCTELKKSMDDSRQEIVNELPKLFENVIGFAPTVENMYRMLFAHIDCFMDYMNRKILGKVDEDMRIGNRKVSYLAKGGDESDLLSRLDIPKTLVRSGDKSKSNLDVYAFPGFYNKEEAKNGYKFVAEYPGNGNHSFENLKKIREVEGVETILNGIEYIRNVMDNMSEGEPTVNSSNIFSRLSVLYDDNDPFKDLQLTGTNAEDDVYKVIYMLLCITFSDLSIGTTTNTDSYSERVANLLYGHLISVRSEFVNKLKEIRNTITTRSLLDNISKYKLLSFTEKNGGYIDLKNGNEIPLKLPKNLNKPVSEFTEDEKKRYFVVDKSKDEEILGFTGDGPLVGVMSNEQNCKEVNNKLKELGSGDEYLKGREDGLNFGDLSVTFPRPVKDVYEEKVGDTTKTHYTAYPSNKWRDEHYVFGNSRITKHTISGIGDDIYKSFISYYNDGTINDAYPLNFVGNKTGKIKVSDDFFLALRNNVYVNGKKIKYNAKKILNDIKPAVNLFTGLKDYQWDTGLLIYNYKEFTSHSTKEAINAHNVFIIEKDDFKPLMYSKRCGNPIKEGDEIDDTHRYAFATYFLASFCECDSLKNLCDIISSSNKMTPLRLVDVLYLGGVLYFQDRYASNGDIKEPWKFHELKTSDGSLGRGLVNIDKTDFTNQSLVDMTEKRYNELKDWLINKFKTWCDGELFGGKNMYDKFVSMKDDDSDCEILEGFMAPHKVASHSLVQSYKTCSERELWLRELAYSYTHFMPLRSNINSSGIKIDSITPILDKLIEKFGDRSNTNSSASSDNGLVNSSIDQKRALYYLLKNLYDKWLCGYSADEFNLLSPTQDLERRKMRFSTSSRNGINAIDTKNSEYNNFVYVDQFFNDISSTFIMNVDELYKTLFNIWKGGANMSTYEFMSFMAEKNELMLMALPVYNNMYNADSIAQVFTPNTLYGTNVYNTKSTIGTTYVVMYANQVSNKPTIEENYEFNRDYVDIGDLINNDGAEDLKFFTRNGSDGLSELNYSVSAFAVSYGKQNQQYFKNINVSMDNPKVTAEVVQNALMLSDAGNNGDTDQPISIGANIYSIYSNRSYTCTVEMLGCANITPLMYFQLNNIPMFRGMYMVINVKHNITPGKMSTVFTGVRISQYSLPNPTDWMLNSHIFDNILTSGGTKEGKSDDMQRWVIGNKKSYEFKDPETGKVYNGSKQFIKEYLGFSEHPTKEELDAKMVTIKFEGIGYDPETKEGGKDLVLTVHKKVEEEVKAIINEIVALPEKPKLYTGNTYTNSYRISSVNTSEGTKYSMHCFGIAIDINKLLNPYCGPSSNNKSGQNTCSIGTDNTSEAIVRTNNSPIVKIFKSHGWGWGGDYSWDKQKNTGGKDYMHFCKTDFRPKYDMQKKES